MADRPLGRIGYVYRGNYNADTQYDKLDTVYDAGAVYQCLVPCKGQTPSTSPDFWAQMCASASLVDRQAAEAAAASAQQSKTDAETAKSAAETAASTAVSAKNTAVTKAGEAADSASSAAGSASDAASSASAAAASAASVDTTALQAAIDARVNKAGDTMSGPLSDSRMTTTNKTVVEGVGDLAYLGNTTAIPVLRSIGDALLQRPSGNAYIIDTDNLFRIRDYIRDTFFRVGSIWMSTDPTSPASIIGGTWESYAAGRVLVGYDGGTFNTVGGYYGSGQVSLTQANLPSGITGTLTLHGGSGGTLFYGGTGVFAGSAIVSNKYKSHFDLPNGGVPGVNSLEYIDFNLGGSGAGVSTYQPSVTAYIWHRIA